MSAFAMAASFVRCAPLQSSASQRWRDTRRNTSLKGVRPTEPLRARVSHSIYGHGRASVAARAEVPDSPGDALSEVAALDNLIDLLTDASEEELPRLVAENVLSFDQKMWMRIAARSDAAESMDDKEIFASLASKLMGLVEAMVQQTESTIQESSKLLEGIIASAADPETGEFEVPLEPASVSRLRDALVQAGASVDERMLNTLYAWIRKSDEDKMDGMVHILQSFLQLYAARELDTGATLLDRVIGAAAADWPGKFDEIIDEGFSEEAFTKDLQQRMEGVVLNLPNGSYSQRVQAEYLKEIEERGKKIYEQRYASK